TPPPPACLPVFAQVSCPSQNPCEVTSRAAHTSLTSESARRAGQKADSPQRHRGHRAEKNREERCFVLSSSVLLPALCPLCLCGESASLLPARLSPVGVAALPDPQQVGEVVPPDRAAVGPQRLPVARPRHRPEVLRRPG